MTLKKIEMVIKAKLTIRDLRRSFYNGKGAID